MTSSLSPYRPADETIATLALALSGAVPHTKLGALIDQTGSAVRLLQLTEADRLFAMAIPAHSVIGKVSADHVARAGHLLSQWRGQGHDPLTVLDPRYPEPLHEIFNRPAFLFVRGTLDYPPDQRSIAVVGARDSDEPALAVTRELTRDLVAAGFVIVSGLARGVDAAAHRAALEAGGRTWAVMGTGLNHIYPAEHASLAGAIVASGGALVSHFVPDQPPGKWTFPQRNITMSGLTMATLVVEASHTSGARLQARVALEHGRTVFLHRRLVERHEWARRFVTDGLHGTVALEIEHASEILERIRPAAYPVISTAA